MKKTILSLISVGLVLGIGVLFFGDSLQRSNPAPIDGEQNVEIRDGVQYIYIDAKGGYSPRVTAAKAGIPSKLIVNTEGTYDCSAALVIRSIEYQKVLPPTGEEEIDLGTLQAGTMVQGTCSMGMYNFVINAS